jgi:polyhydroxyalkanoate synthase
MKCRFGLLLSNPAPFKRAYIWDLLPEVSVVRRCLRRGLQVYLLESVLPSAEDDGLGLADYADRLPSAALDEIAAETGRTAATLAGHSIGGTFAAIFASLHPERVERVALIDAPLAFREHGGLLARTVAASPHARLIRSMLGSPVPGSVMDLLSVSAVHDAFYWQRWSDLIASLTDPRALAIHLRVERWALDEFPLPGQLFEDVLELLYREDRFLRGTLTIVGQKTGIECLRAPVLAVINPASRVVPPSSILTELELVPHLPPLCALLSERPRPCSPAYWSSGRAKCARATMD